jgi:hypothetical protein
MMLFSLVASYHHSAETCSRLSAVSVFMDVKSRSQLQTITFAQRGTRTFVNLTATVKTVMLRRRNDQEVQVGKTNAWRSFVG